MGFTIEQDEAQVTAARRFHINANLRAVQLLDCSAAMEEAPAELEGELVLGFELETSVLTAPQGSARFGVRITIYGNPKGAAADSQNRLFEVACRYALQYVLKPDYAPSREDLDAFKEGNAVFNCWPYAREFIQNVTMRMGLQIPSLPLLRLAAKVTPKKQPAKRSSKAQKSVAEPES